MVNFITVAAEVDGDISLRDQQNRAAKNRVLSHSRKYEVSTQWGLDH